MTLGEEALARQMVDGVVARIEAATLSVRSDADAREIAREVLDGARHTLERNDEGASAGFVRRSLELLGEAERALQW